ncbi:MAG: aminotransferase class V-fold PLP-dependent enzyme, partial [Opitutales bacterium]|nr:aminotransferase class V-fold PLP-dependent enzyme [Opitutales bacterium]
MAYFDNNATTSISGNALEVYRRALSEDWHNPSSPYRSSARMRARMELDREELAKDLGLEKEEIIFTSGATEANNGVFAHFA